MRILPVPPPRLGLVVLVAAALGSGCAGDPPLRFVEGGSIDLGEELIQAYGCGSCHTIPGIAKADGVTAPPLEGFGQRAFVAGQVPNNADNLTRWIVDPESIEPGTAMPDLGVSAEEARSIAAYLLQLR